MNLHNTPSCCCQTSVVFIVILYLKRNIRPCLYYFLFTFLGWASVHISYTLRNKEEYTDSDSSDSDNDVSLANAELKRGRKTTDYSAEKTYVTGFVHLCTVDKH